MNMLPSKQNIAREPKGKPPLRLRRFARVTVVLAWMVFWLNTALFPCCEAVAAGLGGQPPVQAVSGSHTAHASGETGSEHPDQSHNSPCGVAVSAAAATLGQADVLSAAQPDIVSSASGAAISLRPAADSTSTAIPHPAPPPKVPLYLRELRILL